MYTCTKQTQTNLLVGVVVPEFYRYYLIDQKSLKGYVRILFMWCIYKAM